MKRFALILAMALTACAPPPRPAEIPTGAVLAPPHGAVDYCNRNPEDELCKR